MFAWDIVFALLIGILLTAIFSVGRPRTGGMAGVMAFFFIVFLMAWAGGIWIVPFGPSLQGIRIFPFLMTAAIIALLIAAATPPWYRPRTRAQAVAENETVHEVKILFNIFFWLLLVILVAAVAAGYFMPRI